MIYLTKQDIDKIVQILRQYTVKDTEFQDASPMSGEEQIALVQKNTNVKISAKKLQEYLFPLIEYKPGSVYVEDTLLSHSNYNALSANMGRVLYEIAQQNAKDSDDKDFALHELIQKLGFHTVETVQDLQKLQDKGYVQEGMLVYISSTQEYKQYKNSIWEDARLGGVLVSDTYENIPFNKLKNGDIAYAKDTNMFYFKNNNNELELLNNIPIIVSTEEPEYKQAFWIDTTNGSTLEHDAGLSEIKDKIQKLEDKVQKLNNLQTYGVLAGNAETSGLQNIYAGTNPIEPDDAQTSFNEEETEELVPGVDGYEVTVAHIKIKCDTASNFNKNKQNLIDGEIVYFTNNHKLAVYYNGFLHVSSGTGDGLSGGGEGLSLEDLQSLSLEFLMFQDGDNKYKVKVIDGKAIAVPFNTNTTPVGSPDNTWKVYISGLLSLNSAYCGGEASEECMCSHNYIELANGSDEDINLNGLYLLYTDSSKESPSDVGYIWEVLPLTGVIKAGGTFVIRGAQCNTLKASMIKVEGYDMLWEVNNRLISFSQKSSSFYLCVGDSFRELLENKTLNNPWTKSTTKVGYIDSVGFGEGSVGEGSAQFTIKDDWNKILFVRWFMLDPSKQANKEYKSRNTTNLWTYINLDKETAKLGNSIQYYYPDDMKISYSPKPSNSNKDFFTNKTKFSKDRPNMINITFGRQATDGGASKRASRCFNWVSVGYYDEYVQYKKITDNNWITVESITEYTTDEDFIPFLEHYKRLKWCTSYGEFVTTHKCIIKDLTAGVYEYKIGRIGDSRYVSDTLTFTVNSDSEVTSFSFIQTSDQQGFNWAEYTAWKKAAYAISKNESSYRFTINTGDITQSGNRVNEWMDYYDGRQYLRDKEEMFSIGNNDLCGHNSTELTDGNDATSKYNHINVLRYFTFELDKNNPNHNIVWEDNIYPIYSLYSFNYGQYHFICLNSEIAQASSKTYKDWQSNSYKGDDTFAKLANSTIEEWLKKDLQLWKNNNSEPTDCNKAIVYMHEMPFTMTTYTVLNGASAREGSHLNTLNKNGDYRFSRLFKKYGIRLVLGGHKHTYTISKPIYDAPEGYITSSNSINSSINILNDNPEESNYKTNWTALSRKPVIQVTKTANIVKDDPFARYELVSKIDAPTYVMCQATGYKLVSNKEQPSDDTYTIPWLLSYFKQPPGTKEGTTENVKQHYPTYIRYDISSTKIDITAKQIHNIWNVNVDTNKASFDMNNQLIDLSVQAMTLSEISDIDKAAYSITDTTKYTINL